MLIGRRGVLAALTAVLFAAGCANSTSSPPSSPGPASPGPTGSPSSAASSAPSGETISGTVAAGVESNCLLLQGGGKPHLLIFADPAMKAQAKVGATVTVVGTAKPAQMTTCQQGTPFIVTSMRVDRPGA
jgi:hypothetical protein